MTVIIDHPPSFINAFLQQKLGPDFGAIPMFPTVPTDMISIAQDFSIQELTEGTRFTFNGNACSSPSQLFWIGKSEPDLPIE